MTDGSGIVLSRKASVVPLHAERVQKEKIEHALSIDTENENYLVEPYEEIPNKRKPVIGR